MKTKIHPSYVSGSRALHLRQRVHHPRDPRRAARRGVLELPPVLHGPAEADGHRRTRRALPAPRRQGPPALSASSVRQVARCPRVWPPAHRRPSGATTAGRCGARSRHDAAQRRAATTRRGRADGSAAAVQTGEDGQLSAQRDAPVGGQAVLEGVMMRGVSNWAVAVRKPTAEQLSDGELSPEEARAGRDRGEHLPARLGDAPPPRAAPADHPRRGRAGRLDGDRLPRARGLGQRPDAGRGGTRRSRRRSRAACGPARSSSRWRSRSCCSS